LQCGHSASILSPDAALILPAAPGNSPSLTAAPEATMPSFASLIAAIDFIPAHHASSMREHRRSTSPFPMLSQPKLAASPPAPSASTASSWTPPYPPSSPSSRLSALPASCRRRRTSCHLESLRRPSPTLPSPTSSRTAPRQALSPTNVRPASITSHPSLP